MLAGIKIDGEVNQELLQAVCNKLKKFKSSPERTYSLICDIEREHEAKSYCNNRLFWLAWKLEEAGCRVKWFEC